MNKYFYFLSCSLLLTLGTFGQGQGGPVHNPPSVKFIHRHEPSVQVTSASTVVFKVAFSENVRGVDVSDFQLVTISGNVTGTISKLDEAGGNDKMYEVTVSSIVGSGTLRLDLKGSGTNIIDRDGNAIRGGFNSGHTYIIVQSQSPVLPKVQSINRQEPSSQNTTVREVIFRVTFSEAVIGVDVTDFMLAGDASGILAADAITPVGSDGTVYDVKVSSITGNGTLQLVLKDSNTGIKDLDGNSINGGFSNGQFYIVGQSQPQPQTYGFASVTALNPVAVSDGADTQHKPQGKTWFYAGKWWSVITVSTGTKVFRLDGTSWTEALHIFNAGGRADCWVDGNLVHILIHRNTLASPLISLEYDAANNTYKRWSQRPSNSVITFPAGSETATLTVDGTGRLWVASAEVDDVLVWYSDAPYTTWSNPITIASGITDDDICAITKLPGKIGVFWSDQTRGAFGFKTHTDGASATQWSADEMPGAKSAIPGNPRMADDHISLVVASNGTLYAAVKTGYSSDALPLLGLLVRNPSGEWSDLHTVVTVSEDGTQPIVILNEVLGKVKVVYTTITNGGDIVYKESPLSAISFGAEKTLIGGAGPIYNFASSTHQPYHPQVVILATKVTSPRNIVSVLASDTEVPVTMRQTEAATSLQIKIFPTFVKKGTRIVLQTNSTEVAEALIVNGSGQFKSAYRFKGQQVIDTKNLGTGIHYITVISEGISYSRKVVISD